MGYMSYAGRGIIFQYIPRAVFLSPPRCIRPFKFPKNKKGDIVNFGWWTTSNKLKHDRINFLGQGTLESAIHALAGALLAIVTTPRSETSKGRLANLGSAILRRRWLNLEQIEIKMEEIKEGEENKENKHGEKGRCDKS